MNAYLQKHTKTIATPLSYKCTQKQQLQMKLKNKKTTWSLRNKKK
jgi:hypothetical protein